MFLILHLVKNKHFVLLIYRDNKSDTRRYIGVIVNKIVGIYF
jgi:hypothetical protein